MVKADTSITVNKLTLKWINIIRAWYEYEWGRKVTLDETIMQISSFVDWMLAKNLGRIPKKMEFMDYAENRVKDIAADFSNDDIAEFIKAVRSWQEPDPKMWERMKK